MPEIVLPNGRHVVGPVAQAGLEARLERLEIAAGLMAQVLQAANIPPLMKHALHAFALSVAKEKMDRERQP